MLMLMSDLFLVNFLVSYLMGLILVLIDLRYRYHLPGIVLILSTVISSMSML